MRNEQLRFEDVDNYLRRQELDAKIAVTLEHIDEIKDIRYLAIKDIETTDLSYWENLSRQTGMGVEIVYLRARPGPQQDDWPSETKANIYFLSKEELETMPESLTRRPGWLWVDFRFYDGVVYTGSEWLRVARAGGPSQNPEFTLLGENSQILKPSEFW